MDRPVGNIETIVKFINPVPDDIPDEAFEQFDTEEEFIQATVLQTLNEIFSYEIENGEVIIELVEWKIDHA